MSNPRGINQYTKGMGGGKRMSSKVSSLQKSRVGIRNAMKKLGAKLGVNLKEATKSTVSAATKHGKTIRGRMLANITKNAR